MNKFYEQIMNFNINPRFEDIQKMMIETTDNDYQEITNLEDLLEEFKYYNKLKLINIIKKCSYEAYQCFFNQYPQFQKIDDFYQFIYCPSKEMRDTKFKYYLGTDNILSGYNIIGKTIEKIYYQKKMIDIRLFSILYTVKIYIESNLNNMNKYEKFINMSVIEIYEQNDLKLDMEKCKKMYELYIEKKIKDLEIYEFELEQPCNMAILILKKNLYKINVNIDELIKKIKISYVFQLYKQETNEYYTDYEWKQKYFDKIELLIKSKMIILNENTKKRIKELNNMKINEKIKYNIESYLPINKIERKTIVFSENNEMISPLYIHDIKYKNLEFKCILHLIYYLILIEMKISSKKAYELLYQNNNMIKLEKSDIDYIICIYYLKEFKNAYKKYYEKSFQTNKYQEIYNYLSLKKEKYSKEINDEFLNYIHYTIVSKKIEECKNEEITSKMVKKLDLNYQQYIKIKNLIKDLKNVNDGLKNVSMKLNLKMCSILFPNILKYDIINDEIKIYKIVEEELLNEIINRLIQIMMKQNENFEIKIENIIKFIIYIYKKIKDKNIFYNNIELIFMNDKNELQYHKNNYSKFYNELELSQKENKKLNIIINKIVNFYIF
jgi:hypothetical protein